ncbi:hypothetical protein B0H14DRAFT_1108016 [Mycena olivaceomarginata]|nr:hypothetical protein B0H14DRAFT_1108016 [Mycena olivaceomarginata]
MAPEIPAELAERIIDNLCDDHHALAVCGLVCRQWRPRTRLHLFHTVNLQVGSGRHFNRPVSDRLEPFLGLATTAIFASIRKLHLGFTHKKALRETNLGPFVQCTELLELSIEIPRDSADRDEVLPSMLLAQLSTVGIILQNVSHFSLYFLNAQMGVLLEILACFPTMQNCDLVSNGEIGEGNQTAFTFPPGLRTLSTQVLWGAEFLFLHLLSQPSPPRVRKLILGDDEMDMTETSPVARYVQRTADAIEVLHCTIWTNFEIFEKFALKCCRNLREMNITIYNQDIAAKQYAEALLDSAASSGLVEIVIDAPSQMTFGGHSLQPEDALTKKLRSPQFGNLRRFSLCGLEIPLPSRATTE